MPVNILYPFIRLGALVFGRFDLEANSPIEAMRKCKIPVIFVHGEDDAFVPCQMSIDMYDVCTSPKKLITVPLEGHGLAFPIDKEGYLKAVKEFEDVWNR